MKCFLFVSFFFSWVVAKGQDSIAYTNLLQSVVELRLTDSLQINAGRSEFKTLDSNSVKQWFSRLLPSGSHNRLTASVQVVYLVSTKKDGSYISSLEVAVTGNRKRSFYNISSWLYKDYQIVQDNQIIVNEKSYGDMTYYKINGGGRFILASNY
jgi:hypothetical protein